MPNVPTLASPVPPRRSVDLSLAKVHLGMLVLKFLENVHLLLVIRARQPLLLLTLVVHHLLHHTARLAVEVRQLGRVGRDLGNIDLGCVLDDVRPPLHLVDLVQVDLDQLRPVRVGGQGPGRLPCLDGLRKLTL